MRLLNIHDVDMVSLAPYACAEPGPEVVAAMPWLKDTIASLISHRLPFDQVIDGLNIAATPQSAKVMIEFE